MNNSGSHLSKEMLDLIKAIGDSRSKQEEDKVILTEKEHLKVKIRESGVNAKKMKEYLIRAIYIEMLGHDANFAHLYAVNLTQDKNILNKRVGYLASNLLLSNNSEFLIMLIASLQKDIQSNNWIEVCMALNSVIKFADGNIMQAVSEPIMKLLDNKNEQIRKKAVMCLYKFHQVNSSYIPDINERMKRLLCDYDPAVMAASLNYFYEAIKKNPDNFKDLTSSFTVILKQVIEHKLPRDFDYHRFPAPWIQVRLLELLAFLGRDDQNNSENMYEILTQVLRRADDTGINIGYAIVYQCVKTICTIYPNQHLIELAASTISRFLASEPSSNKAVKRYDPNLTCMGINGLALIIQINPTYVFQHQQVIVDCLEENDETLKKNTFDLLYKMTNTENVDVIVDKMMKYLKNTSLESHSRKDILVKITELAEMYAPDKGWFIKIMNNLFVNFGDLITDEILSKLIKLINEWETETDEEEFKQFTIDNYTHIIENYTVLPDSLVKLMGWVLGEYGQKLFRDDEEKVINLLKMLEYLLSKSYDSDITKCILITAITKLHSNINFKELDFIINIIEKYSRDINTEMQQRCAEYKRLLKTNTTMLKNQFTTTMDDLDIDCNLSFLNGYVNDKVKKGARRYDRKHYEAEKNIFEREDMKLNTTPYDEPVSYHSAPGRNVNTFTKGFDNRAPSKNIVTNELKGPSVNKWGKEGYREDVKPITQTIAPQKSNTTSISNSAVTTSGKVDPYMQVSGPKLDSKNQPKDLFTPNTINKRPEPVVHDPKKEVKNQLMKDLFGGVGGRTPTITTATTPKEHPHKRPSTINTPKEQPKQVLQHNEDILGLFSGSSTPQTPQIQQTTTSNINLLDEIFGGVSSTTPIVTTPTPIAQPVAQSNLFSFTNKQPIIPSSVNIVPYETDTDNFGELWTSCPFDEKPYDINTNSVTTPEKYFEIISKLNFFPVQIINNEAIASAKFKNKICLLHAIISTNGYISLQVKSYEEKYNDEIADHLKKYLK
jgi:AP-4 complex subunit epsilon-1